MFITFCTWVVILKCCLTISKIISLYVFNSFSTVRNWITINNSYNRVRLRKLWIQSSLQLNMLFYICLVPPSQNEKKITTWKKKQIRKLQSHFLYDNNIMITLWIHYKPTKNVQRQLIAHVINLSKTLPYNVQAGVIVWVWINNLKLFSY